VIADNIAKQIITRARAEGRRLLDEPSAKTLIASYGVQVPRREFLKSGGEANLVGLSGPLAAKLVSPDLVHKSDVGGVRLGLEGVDAVNAASRELSALADKLGARLDGILIEEMAFGMELVVGGLVDASFGPVLMLGLGGIFVEVMNDTVFRICPIAHHDALDMIEELRGVSLLRGARGQRPVDESTIARVLLALGGQNGLLVELESEVREVDLNPLIVSGPDAYACDARVVLSTE
jgi:hypothetical protein